MKHHHIHRSGNASLALARQNILIDQLRQHLTPQEAHMFGIDETYDHTTNRPSILGSLAKGLGASAVTTSLFLTIGFLATLGLADPAFAAIPTVA